MIEETVNVAEAKKHFSDLLGQVAFGGKQILITKRGKPMARLVPVDSPGSHLCKAKGWLDNNDPFFDMMNQIVQNRSKHIPRVLKANSVE